VSDLSKKPPPNYAPLYCAALYPKLAGVVRAHGYALAVHGSLARDLDLICVPWVENPSEPAEVVRAITAQFAVTVDDRYSPVVMLHGREVWTLHIGFGSCAADLSFMPRIARNTAKKRAARRK
jgi:hypothetical protein